MTQYKIAGLIVEIDNGPIKLQKELVAFKIDETSYIDMKIKLISDMLPPEILIKPLVNNMFNTIYDEGERFYITYHSRKLVTALIIDTTKEEATIYLDPIASETMDTENVVITKDYTNISGPEELVYAIQLAFYYYAGKKGRVPVHSSSIIYDDKAWLFSAASGVGKTTIVNLWKESGYPYNDLNDDVAMIYEENGSIYASSIPWSGTSGASSNNIAKLGGIFFLKRGTDNRIAEYDTVNGIISVNARSFLPNWNREQVDETISICEHLVPQFKTYELYFTKSTDAARAVKYTIDGGAYA